MPPRLQSALPFPLANWHRLLFIMFFARLVSALGFSVISPFLPLYVESLGTHGDQKVALWAGLVFSVQAMTMALASPLWGALADRFGRKLMVQRAMFGGALIFFLMAFARSVEELVLLRAIQGLLTGVMSATNALIVASVPRERTGFAIGSVEVGRYVGVSVGPLIGGLLADAFGFQLPFVVTAALLLVGGVLVHWGVREQFEPLTAPGGRVAGFVAEWRHILTSPGVVLTYGLRFLSQLGHNTLSPILALFVAALLASTEQAATATGLMFGLAALAGMVSAVVLGRLGDRIGHRRVLVGAALAAALFYLPQSLVTEVWQLLFLQTLTGAAVGGMMPALGALLAGFTTQGEEGAVYGLDNATVSAAGALAPLLGGAMAAWFSLSSAFLLTGAVYLGMALLAFRFLPGVPAASQAGRAGVEGQAAR